MGPETMAAIRRLHTAKFSLERISKTVQLPVYDVAKVVL